MAPPMKSSPSFLVDNNLGSKGAEQACAPKKQAPEEDVVIESRHGDAGGQPSFIFRHFLHKDARISKLVTREDPYHLHKTLGMLSLLNFLYRYAFCYNMYGNLGYNGMEWGKKYYVLDWLTMLTHTCLALSSIIFRVPRKRLNNKPMVIYEEYRQHAMVFTVRCLSVYAVATLLPNAPAWLCPVVVMAHHLLADRTTSIHGSPGNTAVRSTEKRAKLSPTYRWVGKLYSLYQFLAIGSHILPNERLPDLAFNAIIAIQSSAFMMTLYRKRIVRGRTHMVVYAFCLLVSGFHICRLIGMWSSVLITATFMLRINMPREWSNKYVCWALFVLASHSDHVFHLASSYMKNENIFTTGNMLDSTATKGTAVAAFVYTAFIGERALLGKKSSDKQA
jgi:hypothetical protein